MSGFSITNSLSSLVTAINPANWTPESRKTAATVAKVTLVTYTALTVLQSLPTAIAVKEHLYYNCQNGAIVNAVYAFGSVLYKTWDIEQAREASSMMYTIGSQLYTAAKSSGATHVNTVLRACIQASDNFPYPIIYHN